MKSIKLVKDLESDAKTGPGKDKEVNELFSGSFRRLIEVRMRNCAVLSRHRANEPIIVF